MLHNRCRRPPAALGSFVQTPMDTRDEQKTPWVGGGFVPRYATFHCTTIPECGEISARTYYVPIEIAGEHRELDDGDTHRLENGQDPDKPHVLQGFKISGEEFQCSPCQSTRRRLDSLMGAMDPKFAFIPRRPFSVAFVKRVIYVQD